jgi:hypothetical protein
MAISTADDGHDMHATLFHLLSSHFATPMTHSRRDDTISRTAPPPGFRLQPYASQFYCRCQFHISLRSYFPILSSPMSRNFFIRPRQPTYHFISQRYIIVNEASRPLLARAGRFRIYFLKNVEPSTGRPFQYTPPLSPLLPIILALYSLLSLYLESHESSIYARAITPQHFAAASASQRAFNALSLVCSGRRQAMTLQYRCLYA